jgi:NADPH-dependent 2,4-dienoyl-CoA reductase/sulfur reductase-like enzyme/formate hydrogenlyase subunit 6/NADH:ubiquinone oxidoreductase subunit I/bacterioferritin-associated ferredoxin
MDESQPSPTSRRVVGHPVLADPVPATPVRFRWCGEQLEARPGEVISSALTAAGVSVYGRHPRDGAPLGLFCANGQCASCMVIADGVAVKACMTPVRDGMTIVPADRVPDLPPDGGLPSLGSTVILPVEVLVIGAGPAGLAAAIELGVAGVGTLVVDDKVSPGGKLVLQTHKFFGSHEHTSAGTRGTEIAAKLAAGLAEFPSVDLWTSATAVGVFGDRRVGLVRDGAYWLIEPEVVLIATGARERQLLFPGHTLPGVMGAGAFQTLVNRDRVTPGHRVLVVGAGNVGLIAAYHALQAGLEVVGVVEVAPRVGGYQVHADKLRRLGVPVHLAHTVSAVHGSEHVESVTIAAVDSAGAPIPATERTFAVDTVLVAAGLTPLDELATQAETCGMAVFRAGDAGQVSEASAAAFDGRLVAHRIQAFLGSGSGPVPEGWTRILEDLRSPPGPQRPAQELDPGWDVFPILRCTEEIPCNPCAAVCRRQAIVLEGDPLRGVPRFTGVDCTACHRCVAACPGQAITVVDRREDPLHPVVTVPFEMDAGLVAPGSQVVATDEAGMAIGRFEVRRVIDRRSQHGTRLVELIATAGTATRIAGIQVQDPMSIVPIAPADGRPLPDDVVVCRCEHVTVGEVREAIRGGVRDVNELKARLRVCMGACCGKNCPEHIDRIYREEGVDTPVAPATLRPLFLEVPLATFAAGSGGSP